MNEGELYSWVICDPDSGSWWAFPFSTSELPFGPFRSQTEGVARLIRYYRSKGLPLNISAVD